MPTNFPSGLSNYGIPLLPVASPFANAQSQIASVGTGRQLPGGTVYFVSSLLGTDGNAGTKISLPLATFGQALTLVNPGDTVILLPGHVETTTKAAGINCNVSNILVIGLGVGALRPTFKYSTVTTATFDIVKDNITFYNVRWDMTGIAALVKGINVKTAANDVTFDTCEFVQSSATNACATGILTDANANNLRINNCRFTQTGAGTAMTNAIQVVGGDGLQITNSFFCGLYHVSSGIIGSATTACTNYVIRGCAFVNQTSSATKAIVMQAASTGIVGQNVFGIGSGAAPITSAAGWWAGNWSAAAAATNGTLV